LAEDLVTVGNYYLLPNNRASGGGTISVSL